MLAALADERGDVRRQLLAAAAVIDTHYFEWADFAPLDAYRAAGVNYDIRKVEPYGIYERFDFRIPLGEKGDCYDRIMSIGTQRSPRMCTGDGE